MKPGPGAIDPGLRVAELVASHPEYARVLQDHRIDFSCQGERTLAAACAQRGLPLDEVLADLVAATDLRAGAPHHHGGDDPRALSIPALVARIIDKHHGWLREGLPWIRDMAAKVGRLHGKRDPRLVQLAEVVARLHDHFFPHLDEEEQQLFPALMAIPRGVPDRERVRAALSAMEAEHRHVSALLERIRTLTDDHSPPGWACRTYRTLLAELDHLEEDLLRHLHLENHVLAAKARALLDAGTRAS